jgi:pimeloyl-ACP methyl ester carboxylesterase
MDAPFLVSRSLDGGRGYGGPTGINDGDSETGVEDASGLFRIRDAFQSFRRMLRPLSEEAQEQGTMPDGSTQDRELVDSLPLAYRYYSRKRARPPSAGSIPIVLLGPNADHWKVTSQQLQHQGFSVIACERVVPEGQDRSPYAEPYDQLIRNLLDALRWPNAVVVACDEEAVLALQAALQMAPDRIAGLVLCGNLKASHQFAARFLEGGGTRSTLALDTFLQRYLACPFSIVWDGDTSGTDETLLPTESLPLSETDLFPHRSLILGGGTAPHRRRPEQLAWVITRFVEEQIAAQQVSRSPAREPHKPKVVEAGFQLPLGLSTVFSQEAMVVTGRVLATTLAYGIALKIFLYQYGSVRSGIFDFQSKLHEILYTPEKIATAFVGLFRWIPRLMGRLCGTTVAPTPAEEAKTEKDQVDERVLEDQDNNRTDSKEFGEDDNHGDATDADEGNDDDHDPMEREEHIYGPLFFLDHVIV